VSELDGDARVGVVGPCDFLTWLQCMCEERWLIMLCTDLTYCVVNVT
jgi:hypothetical protein